MMNEKKLFSLGLLGVFPSESSGWAACFPGILREASSVEQVAGVYRQIPSLAGSWPYVACHSLEVRAWTLGDPLRGPSQIDRSELSGKAMLSLQLEVAGTSGFLLNKHISLSLCVPFKNINNGNSLKLPTKSRVFLCCLRLPLTSRCSLAPAWSIQTGRGTALIHLQGAGLAFQLIDNWELSLSNQYQTSKRSKSLVCKLQLSYAPSKGPMQGNHSDIVAFIHPQAPSEGNGSLARGDQQSLAPLFETEEGFDCMEQESLLSLLRRHEGGEDREAFQEMLYLIDSRPIELLKADIPVRLRHRSGEIQTFMSTLFQKIGAHPHHPDLISAVFKRFKGESEENHKWLLEQTLPFILSNYAHCKESNLWGELQELIKSTEIDDWKTVLTAQRYKCKANLLEELFSSAPWQEGAINLIFETFNETDHDRAWFTQQALPLVLLNYTNCKKLEIWEKLWTVVQEAEIEFWKLPLKRIDTGFSSMEASRHKEALSLIFERCNQNDDDRAWFTQQALSLLLSNYAIQTNCNNLLNLIQHAGINDWETALEQKENLERFVHPSFLKNEISCSLLEKFNQSDDHRKRFIKRALPHIISKFDHYHEHLPAFEVLLSLIKTAEANDWKTALEKDNKLESLLDFPFTPLKQRLLSLVLQSVNENPGDKTWLLRKALPVTILKVHRYHERFIAFQELLKFIQVNSEITDWKTALGVEKSLARLLDPSNYATPLKEKLLSTALDKFKGNQGDKKWFVKRALPYIISKVHCYREHSLPFQGLLNLIQNDAEVSDWKTALKKKDNLGTLLNFSFIYFAPSKEKLLSIALDRFKENPSDKKWFLKEALPHIIPNVSHYHERFSSFQALLNLVQNDAEIDDWRTALSEKNLKILLNPFPDFQQNHPQYQQKERGRKVRTLLVSLFLGREDLGDLDNQSISNLLAQMIGIQKARTTLDYHNAVNRVPLSLDESPLYNGFLDFICTLPTERAYNLLVNSGFDLPFPSNALYGPDGTEGILLPDGIVEMTLRLIVLNINYSEHKNDPEGIKGALLEKINRLKLQFNKIFEKHKVYIKQRIEERIEVLPLPVSPDVFYHKIAPHLFGFFHAKALLKAILNNSYGPEATSFEFGRLNTGTSKLSEHFSMHHAFAYERFKEQWDPLIKSLALLDSSPDKVKTKASPSPHPQ